LALAMRRQQYARREADASFIGDAMLARSGGL